MIKKIEEIKSHHSATSFLIAKLIKNIYIYIINFIVILLIIVQAVLKLLLFYRYLYISLSIAKKKINKKKKKLVTLFKSVLLNIPNKVKQEMSVGLFPWCYIVFLLMSSLQCKLTFFKSESATFLETLRYNVF